MCAQACQHCEECHFETGQCLCPLGHYGETCGSSKQYPHTSKVNETEFWWI